MVPIESIRPNPQQPRKYFDEAELSQLAESLRERGMLQPIIVRPVGDGYEIVAGERRWRAAKLAGFAEIPAIVREIAHEHVLELSLIENLHRKNLNPIEKAGAYSILHERGRSHEQIGAITGEEPRTVRYAVQLLDLCPDALALIRSGALDGSHGKALLSVTDPAMLADLASEAAAKRWTVRQLQDRIRRRQTKWPARAKTKSAAADELQGLFEQTLNVKATVLARRRALVASIRLDFATRVEVERVTAWMRRAAEGLK